MDISKTKRILIIRFSSIGDIILCSGVVSALKKKNPQLSIDVLVKSGYEDTARLIPGIDKVLSVNPRRGLKDFLRVKREIDATDYDVIADLHRNLRSYFLYRFCRAKHRIHYARRSFGAWALAHLKLNLLKQKGRVVQRYMKPFNDLFGTELQPENVGLKISEECGKKFSSSFINRYTKRLGVFPGAKHFTKRLPAEICAQACDIFINKFDGEVVLIGGDEEVKIINETKALMKNRATVFISKRIEESACVASLCDVILANDSAGLHIAQGAGKNVVAIFGPTVEDFGFFPYNVKYEIVQKDIPCRPCSHHGTNVCPKGHFKCMKSISAEEIIGSVAKLIG